MLAADDVVQLDFPDLHVVDDAAPSAAACLLAIAHFFGSEALSSDGVEKLLIVESHGDPVPSTEAIVAAAVDLGLRASAASLTLDRLEAKIASGTPVMAKFDGENHVVVTGVSAAGLLVVNPTSGTGIIPLADWPGRGIVVDSPKAERVVKSFARQSSHPHAALAGHYAGVWNLLHQQGERVPVEELQAASDELHGGEYCLHCDAEGKWTARHADELDGKSWVPWRTKTYSPAIVKEFQKPKQQANAAPASNASKKPVQPFTGIDSHGHKWVNGKQVKRDDLDAEEEKPAPKQAEPAEKVPGTGGVYLVNLKGEMKLFKGGQWLSPDEVKNLPQEQKDKIAAAVEERRRKRLTRGDIDPERLREKLASAGHDRDLTDEEKRLASKEFRALYDYHGELTLHRIEELARQQVALWKKLKPKEGSKADLQLRSNLARLYAMAGMAKRYGITGKVSKEEQQAAEPKVKPEPAAQPVPREDAKREAEPAAEPSKPKEAPTAKPVPDQPKESSSASTAAKPFTGESHGRRWVNGEMAAESPVIEHVGNAKGLRSKIVQHAATGGTFTIEGDGHTVSAVVSPDGYSLKDDNGHIWSVSKLAHDPDVKIRAVAPSKEKQEDRAATKAEEPKAPAPLDLKSELAQRIREHQNAGGTFSVEHNGHVSPVYTASGQEWFNDKEGKPHLVSMAHVGDGEKLIFNSLPGSKETKPNEQPAEQPQSEAKPKATEEAPKQPEAEKPPSESKPDEEAFRDQIKQHAANGGTFTINYHGLVLPARAVMNGHALMDGSGKLWPVAQLAQHSNVKDSNVKVEFDSPSEKKEPEDQPAKEKEDLFNRKPSAEEEQEAEEQEAEEQEAEEQEAEEQEAEEQEAEEPESDVPQQWRDKARTGGINPKKLHALAKEVSDKDKDLSSDDAYKQAFETLLEGRWDRAVQRNTEARELIASKNPDKRKRGLLSLMRDGLAVPESVRAEHPDAYRDAERKLSQDQYRSDLHRGKQNERDEWTDKAFEAGIRPKDLHERVKEILEESRQDRADRRSMIDASKKLFVALGHNPESIMAQIRKGTIEDRIPGLDLVAESMKNSYPEQFVGYDKDGDYTHDLYTRMADLLHEGIPSEMSKDDAYEKAFDELSKFKEANRHGEEEREAGADEDEEETVPPRDWDDDDDDPFDSQYRAFRDWIKKTRRRRVDAPGQQHLFDPEKHPHAPAGSSEGGRFVSTREGESASTEPSLRPVDAGGKGGLFAKKIAERALQENRSTLTIGKEMGLTLDEFRDLRPEINAYIEAARELEKPSASEARQRAMERAKQLQAQQTKIDSALARYANRDQTAQGGGLFGGEDVQSRLGFAKLPNGAPIVFTEGEFQGQTGKIVRDVDAGTGAPRIVAQVDGREGLVPISPDAIEPLDAHQSWRVEGAGTGAGTEQRGIFTADQFLPKRESALGVSVDLLRPEKRK